MIVHVNGFPGVGKLTVARELAKCINARLIDNHLMIDLAAALSDRGSETYFSVIDRLTSIALDEITDQPPSRVIFTNALTAELPEDRSRLDRLIETSAERSQTFVSILLECNEVENRRRIASTERRASKLTDADQLSQLRREFTMYHPERELSLRLDNSTLTPQEAANAIAEFIDRAFKNSSAD